MKMPGNTCERVLKRLTLNINTENVVARVMSVYISLF